MDFVVYKWRCKDESIKPYYIGYSRNFSGRIKGHKKDYKMSIYFPGNGVKYVFVRKYGGWDGWEFEIIGRFSSEREARRYESTLIMMEQPLLNMCGLSDAEILRNSLVLKLDYGIVMKFRQVR
jgi:hypothetical protein